MPFSIQACSENPGDNSFFFFFFHISSSIYSQVRESEKRQREEGEDSVTSLQKEILLSKWFNKSEKLAGTSWKKKDAAVPWLSPSFSMAFFICYLKIASYFYLILFLFYF